MLRCVHTGDNVTKMHATATVAVLSFSPLAFWHFGIINRNDLAQGAKASTTLILVTKDYKKVLAVVVAIVN